MGEKMTNLETHALKERRPPFISTSHESADAFCRILGGGIGKSQWVARGGMNSNFYFDFDRVYSATDLNKSDLSIVHSFVSDKLNEIVSNTGASYVGFVSPKQGPVGILQLRSIIAEELSVPSIIIHVSERLLRKQIWFERSDYSTSVLTANSKVLLFADAATSGGSLYKAATIVRKFNAYCEDAVVLFDRMQGASDRLNLKKLTLSSFVDRDFFFNKGKLDDKDTVIDRIAPRLEFESLAATVA